MRTRLQPGLSETLGDGLNLRTPASEDDFERIAAFNAAIHGPEIAPFTLRLLRDYPGMESQDQVVVENDQGEIVSALCLIPWTWRCEGASLPVGEMGIVGTAETYRGRGLVRAQVAYFKRRLRERGCVLSIIQGIPYFYRQFGYQYALPLEGGYRWEFRHIPNMENGDYTRRRAEVGDIPYLSSLYDSAIRDLCFHTERSTAVWEYLLAGEDETDAMVHDTWIVEERERGNPQPLGYMRIPRFHFGEELVIDEAYCARHDVGLWMLDQARQLAEERGKPGIRLNLPASSYLVRLALAHEGTSLGTYSWQIHIPDDAALLRAMTPVLEDRLQNSPFVEWTGTLRISFFTRALSLRFEQGVLLAVENSLPADECEVRMPYAAFTPLVTGHHSFEELRTQYPDSSAHGGWRLLLDTLFPKRPSFIYTAY